MSLDAVSQIMREVADAEIRPRFRALAESDISLKGPGDYVTAADIAAEAALTTRLREVLDVPVVGEEAVAADPDVELLLADARAAWVVDPVDGTSHFVRGSHTYAVMVALVRGRRANAGWILHPETGDIFTGAEGEPATLNGEPIASLTVDNRPLDTWRGALLAHRFTEAERDHFDEVAPTFGDLHEPRLCAGWDYADLLKGEVDFLIFTQPKPWDHAPAAAIVRAAGGRVAFADGTDYEPTGRRDYIIAAPADAWERVRDALLPEYALA